MHRTEGANKTADNKFTDGPPGTTVTDDWLNAVQEEIANVIESAGLVLKTAATETNLQLREALLKTVPMPRGYIDGLIMSNNAVDAVNDIDISIGKCRDYSDAETISLTSIITKQIDANWAEGTNQGGFPSGLALAVATWYHVFVIMSTDGTKVDAGFDTSLIATNLLADATDYSIFRRVGSVLTDGASGIIAFHQQGNLFLWSDPPLDINAAAFAANVDQLCTLSIPLGIKTGAIFNATGISMLDTKGYYFSSPDVTDENTTHITAPLLSLGAGNISGTGDATEAVGMVYNILSNTASQIRAVTDDVSTLYIASLGWIDQRGKDA